MLWYFRSSQQISAFLREVGRVAVTCLTAYSFFVETCFGDLWLPASKRRINYAGWEYVLFQRSISRIWSGGSFRARSHRSCAYTVSSCIALDL